VDIDGIYGALECDCIKFMCFPRIGFSFHPIGLSEAAEVADVHTSIEQTSVEGTLENRG
jgi:hypothetical protein